MPPHALTRTMTMKFILGLIIALFSFSAFANITADQEYILNKYMRSAGEKVQLGTLVQRTSNLIVAKYSYAVQGGTSTSDISLLTDLTNKKSYAVIPNKAIIKRAWVDVLTQPTSGGSATVALKAQSSGDILAATAKASLTTGEIDGVPDGTATHMVKLTADSTVKATVGVATLTAGKFNVYIEYVLGD